MRTKEDYETAVKASSSISDMCRFFNILPMGGNFDTMKHSIAKYELDTSHFTIPVALQDNHGKQFSRNKNNKRILIEKYGYVCSNSDCKLSEWEGKELVLQVDHIDGQNTNDSIDNLRLLCPNCHSETETFCMPANNKSLKNHTCDCGQNISRSATICNICLNIKNLPNFTVIPPKKYKKTELEEIAKDCYSYTQVLKKLNKRGGGAHRILINAILYYEIDVSHFTGQSWNKGKSLKENPKSKTAWKNKLLINRGHKCENCKRTHWISGKLIPLELEHIDGNNKNNVEENLKLLCSNCHSQTKTWKRKKTALSKTEKICLDCDKAILQKSERCLDCYKKYRVKNQQLHKNGTYTYKGYLPQKDNCACGNVKLIKSPQCEGCHKKSLERIVWPSTEELLAMIQATSFYATGKKLGVSDNAVRKRIKNHPVSE